MQPVVLELKYWFRQQGSVMINAFGTELLKQLGKAHFLYDLLLICQTRENLLENGCGRTLEHGIKSLAGLKHKTHSPKGEIHLLEVSMKHFKYAIHLWNVRLLNISFPSWDDDSALISTGTIKMYRNFSPGFNEKISIL